MSTLFELVAIRKALKQFPDVVGVKASSDPTMLFSGLVWGKRIFVQYNLMHALWPLKTALFQSGDKIIEVVIDKVGLDNFKEHFLKNENENSFYQFDPDHIQKSHMGESHKLLLGGYEKCLKQLVQNCPQYQESIKAQWVKATNQAIRSTFFLSDWQKALEVNSHEQMMRVAKEEEEAKNVTVVATIVLAAKVLGEFSYKNDPVELIRASSRWFTLIDDYLDLEEDVVGAQPNYLVGLLHKHDEFLAWSEYSNTNRMAEFKTICQKTWADFSSQLEAARIEFKKLFPVLPALFAWQIERKAKKKGQSPF